MKTVFGYTYIPASHLKVTDDDAADFLQSQFSNDLRPFDAGNCTYGLWLDVKGRVIADSMVLCEERNHFLVLSEHSPASTITRKLENHIIADDVIIESMPPGAAIALVGDRLEDILDSISYQAPANGSFTRVDDVYLFPGRRSLKPSFELWSGVASKIENLMARLTELGVEFVSIEKIQFMRMAAGVPLIPDEIGPADLPGEGAMVGSSVSLTKGCYLGQEVVARMHNVGRAQRALFRMTGSGIAPGCPLPLYDSKSKNVGELRSAYASENNWTGVALLKTRFVEPGIYLKHEFGNAKVESLFAMDKDKVG